MDEITTIHTLSNKGRSINNIAKILGISRNTVRKHLRNKTSLGFDSNLNSELKDPSKSQWHLYYDQILKMLLQEGFCGTRIFDELREMGAQGNKSSFYEYLKWIRSHDSSSKARARFETEPGEQAQWDWAVYNVKIGHATRKVYVCSIILGYSRYRYSIGSFDCSLPTIFEFLNQAFNYFGGSCRELLMDNAKQMVTNPNRKSFCWNTRFLKCMAHYNIEPKACLVKHSWTKGKIENPFRYLENHFIKGGDFSDLDDFNNQLREFTDKVNHKNHQGINTSPSELFNLEKEFLTPLPKDNFFDSQVVIRKVRNDCLINYQSNQYSVPYTYALQTVIVYEYLGNKLIIESSHGARIAIHDVCTEKGRRIIDPNHFAGLIDKYAKSGCIATFHKTFPDDAKMLDDLQSLSSKNWKSFLSQSMRMLDLYQPNQVKQALAYCIEIQITNVSILKAYLSNHFDVVAPTNDIALLNKNINHSMEGVKRNLRDYNAFLYHDETQEVLNGTV